MDITTEAFTWSSLPAELKKSCFSFLLPIELVNSVLVLNKECNKLGSSEDLWKQHYKDVWESIGLGKFPAEPSYKKMFLRRLKRIDYRVVRYKCRVCNVLVLGDEQTGKTALIDGTRDAFTKSVVASKPPEVRQRMQNIDPDRITFKKSTAYGMTTSMKTLMKLYDTQYQRGEEEEKYLDTIRDQLLDCDAIILTYDVTKMETLARLRDFWLPFIRRFCPREIPLICVGTKKDLRGSLPPSMKIIVDDLITNLGVEIALQCFATDEETLMNVFDAVPMAILDPTVAISNETRTHYRPYVQTFLTRIFQGYDQDKDKFLTKEEFLKCYSGAYMIDVDIDQASIIQQSEFSPRLDLLRTDGKISLAAYIWWFERCCNGDFLYVWNFLQVTGFRRLFHNSLYPPKLQRMLRRAKSSVVTLEDLRVLYLKRSHDEEVKYWIASSYWGLTVLPQVRDHICRTDDVPEIDIFRSLLMEKNPLTAQRAAIAISHFLEDKYHRSKFIRDKAVLTTRLTELLSLDLDPPFLEGYSRPLVGLSNDDDIKGQLLNSDFVKVIPKLMLVDFADLQYNIGQIVCCMLTHKQRARLMTNELIDSIVQLMRSTLPAVIEAGLHCACMVIANPDTLDILVTMKCDQIIDGVVALSKSEHYKFHHPATVALSTLTKYSPSLSKLFVERKTYLAFVRLLKETPVTKCPPSSLIQVYEAIRFLNEEILFRETVDITELFAAILAPVKVVESAVDLRNFMECLYELSAVSISLCGALIKALEMEILLSTTPEILAKYFKVIEGLAYVTIGKSITNLTDAGFIKFIKNQLKAFKSTKAVIPLLDALGILATKQNVKDDELNVIFDELLGNEDMMQDPQYKLVLEWCIDSVNGPGVLKEKPEGVYLSDVLKTKFVKLSRDRLSARLDFEYCHTVAANIPVTKGKWYYEVHLHTGGRMSIGWASYQALKGTIESHGAVGDGHSYAVDLHEKLATHNSSTKDYGIDIWNEAGGDVLGCYLDLDKSQILYSLNGVQQGVAFENVSASGGLFPAITLHYSAQQVKFNFGAEPFVHQSTMEDFKPYNLVLDVSAV